MHFWRKLRSLFRRNRLEAEMAEEMQAHLEFQTEKNIAAGLDADEARDAALRQFGNVASLQERAREGWGWSWFDDLTRDVQITFRGLRRNPGFTVVVVATLAVGIALNTIAFSFYHMLLGKPLAVRAPEEVLRVSASASGSQAPFTHGEYEDLRSRLKADAAVIAASPLQVLLAGITADPEAEQKPAAVQFVSDDFFATLGVAAKLGRTFAYGEREAIVLSHDAWQQRFNGDPQVVGRSVLLQGVPVTIVGVTPEQFGGITPPSTPDYWVPMKMQPRLLPQLDWLGDGPSRTWMVLLRSRSATTLSQVGAEVAAIARAWRQPDGNPLQTRVEPAKFFQLEDRKVRAVCLVLLLAVGCILLVGCINVVNLLAARNTGRQHELAMKVALGAGRGRLLRQLCTESVVLGLLGGGLGFAVAAWSCGLLHVQLTGFIRGITGGIWSPFLDLTPDWTVFGYTFGLAILAGLCAGLPPAWRASRVDLEAALKRNATGPGSSSGGRSRNTLLALQIAASMLLLSGAGLLLRSASRAMVTSPGFETKHLLAVVAWSNLSTTAASPTEQLAQAQSLDEALTRVPGVTALAGADRLPLTGHSVTGFTTDENQWIDGCVPMKVDGRFFTTLGMPLLAGRSFTAQEARDRAPLVIVTESGARKLWPGKNPLGRRLTSPARESDGLPAVTYTVIGVVGDARFSSLAEIDKVNVFFPQAAVATWLVRTADASPAAIRAIRAALREVNPVLANRTAVWPMEDGPMRVQRSFARIPAGISTVLGLIAVALAAVGIFGVVSFVVAQRTREFGIRLALGSTRPALVGLVLRQTFAPAAWGLGVGLLGAVAVAVLLIRLVLQAQLPDITYGAQEFPIAAIAGAAGLLLAIVLVAAWLPARRAAKVDPMVVLRAE